MKNFRPFLCILVALLLLFPSLVYADTNVDTNDNSSSASGGGGGTAISLPIIRPPEIIKEISVKGILVKCDLEGSIYQLNVNEKSAFLLTGNTEGMDSLIGQNILVRGVRSYKESYDGPVYTRIGFVDVIEFKPIVETPNIITVMGTLEYNIYTDAVEFMLKTAGNGIFLLTGKTDGMEEYVGKYISVKGIVNYEKVTDPTKSMIRYLEVIEFKPYPVDTKPVKIIGVLKENNIEGKHFELQVSNNKVYVLTGKIEGIEAYLDQRIIVTGYIKQENNFYMRGEILEVIDYKPVYRIILPIEKNDESLKPKGEINVKEDKKVIEKKNKSARKRTSASKSKSIQVQSESERPADLINERPKRDTVNMKMDSIRE